MATACDGRLGRKLWDADDSMIRAVKVSRASLVPTLLEIAHHEAGHAVAALAWCSGVSRVTIRPAEPQYLGKCWIIEHQTSDELAEALASSERAGDQRSAWLLRQQLLGRARFALAGHCTERLFNNRRATFVFDQDEADAWHSLELAREEPECAVVRERRHTQRFLRKHWLHVQAVAAALVEHETLSGEALGALIERLPRIRDARIRWSRAPALA